MCERESHAKVLCVCGNAVKHDGQRCRQCQSEEIAESDGHGYKSGRKDNSDTWVMRYELGIELQDMAYNDSE